MQSTHPRHLLPFTKSAYMVCAVIQLIFFSTGRENENNQNIGECNSGFLPDLLLRLASGGGADGAL